MSLSWYHKVHVRRCCIWRELFIIAFCILWVSTTHSLDFFFVYQVSRLSNCYCRGYWEWKCVSRDGLPWSKGHWNHSDTMAVTSDLTAHVITVSWTGMPLTWQSREVKRLVCAIFKSALHWNTLRAALSCPLGIPSLPLALRRVSPFSRASITSRISFNRWKKNYLKKFI